MRKIALFILWILLSNLVMAQSKTLSTDPTKWSMEDMKRFAAMSPAEQEAFKKKMLQLAEGQLKEKTDAANITLDETVLPSFQIKPPVKDVKRLALIPVKPPTREQLLNDVTKMEAALKTAVGPQTVQKVEQFVASKSIKEIQAASAGGWYDSNPQSALLLGMHAAAKEPGNVLGWNNLAAIMNMSGLEHQAIPILQHWLAENPGNSMLLNNMGQAFLGLGDLVKSKQFFERCLATDELHPEANRSMALIYLFGNDMANAIKHFAKEMQIGQRKSSLAYLVKSGQREKINLAALRKRKMQMDGKGSRDFFTEISLEKFKIPDPPASSLISRQWQQEHEALFQSISEEMLFWSQASLTTPEQNAAAGKLYPGIYHNLVEELISDLSDQYLPLLKIIDEDDVAYLSQLQYDYVKKDKEIKCPDDPGLSVEAYNKLCCDLKTPLIDEFMAKHNEFISSRIKEAQSNYKQYINGLISIVQLDPSLANSILVYKSVSAYFAFLHHAIGSYVVMDPYMTCYNNRLTSEEAKDMLKSAREINLQCPSWLKMNLSLKVASLKADCNGYSVEADVYKLITVGVEKKFKTGTSTLYVGAGISGSWKGVASGSINQQFYVVFDNNNEFADLGMRGGASGSLAGGMLSADFGYDFAMNSGFNAQATVKSPWMEKYEKALSYVSKK